MDSFDVNIGQHFLRLGELTTLNPYNKEDCPGLRLTTTEARFKRPELFIDSVLNFVPTQHFYIDGGMRQWILLDGNKRLNAVKDFLDNKFPFFDDVAGIKCKGLYLKDVEKKFLLTRMLMDYPIHSLLFRSGIPVEIKLELRKRILGQYELNT